jgi:PKD repeat protein
MYKLGIMACILVILLVTVSGCSLLSTTSKPAMKDKNSSENFVGETPTLPEQYIEQPPGIPRISSDGTVTPTLNESLPLISSAQAITINGTSLSGNGTNSSTSNSGGSIPDTRFTTNVVMGFAPLMVQFTDSSLNLPTSWFWDFGDGGFSTLQNPGHIYYAGGQYTIIFTATNMAGLRSLNSIDYVSVYQPGFSVVPDKGNAPLTVNFTDTGNGSPQPTGWFWDFGDIGAGNTSNQQNWTHQYVSPGTYDVKFRISGKAGVAWVNRSAAVIVV